jgi:hypothetical protein
MRMTDQRTQLEGAEYDDDGAVQVCGARWGIGVPVFRWTHPRGFNGYTTARITVNGEDRAGSPATRVLQGDRFTTRRPEAVRQFVIHHSGGDGATPASMYETLWNQRNLSVQYAVEDDGRVWQFLDASEGAWHAGPHNGISVGAECCLYPLAKERPDFYSPERCAKTGNLPHAVVEDTIHGKILTVFAFTDPQVESLSRIIAATWLGLYAATGRPQFASAPGFPRMAGAIPHTVVPAPLEHVGLLGHLQCTANKIDPAGFPWERCEARVAELLAAWRGRVGRTRTP